MGGVAVFSIKTCNISETVAIPYKLSIVPKSTTLDDFERPLHALFQNMCIFQSILKIWMKIGPYYQRRTHSGNLIIAASRGLLGQHGFLAFSVSADCGFTFQGFCSIFLRWWGIAMIDVWGFLWLTFCRDYDDRWRLSVKIQNGHHYSR